MAVLTNGLNWWFYLPLQEGNWEERRFSVIELRNPDVSQTADLLVDFLSRENVRSGVAVAYAESLLDRLWKDKKIEEALPRAWNQLITDPHDQLLALLNQKVKELCGWGANLDQIKRFLANYQNPLTHPQSIPHLIPLPLPRQQPTRWQLQSTKVVRFTFHGQFLHYGVPWTRMLMTPWPREVWLHSSEFQKVLELTGTKALLQPQPARDEGKDQKWSRPIGNSGYFAETDLTTSARLS